MYAYRKPHIYLSGELPLNPVYTPEHQIKQRFFEFFLAHKYFAVAPCKCGPLIGIYNHPRFFILMVLYYIILHMDAKVNSKLPNQEIIKQVVCYKMTYLYLKVQMCLTFISMIFQILPKLRLCSLFIYCTSF